MTKVNKCEEHKATQVYWEGKNDECPLCLLYEANKKLVKRLQKVKEKLEKYRKKKRKKDDIPF
jgi:hypothetical protein